jgi:hypothetical protein
LLAHGFHGLLHFFSGIVAFFIVALPLAGKGRLLGGSD